jgi:hypothetical protein
MYMVQPARAPYHQEQEVYQDCHPFVTLALTVCYFSHKLSYQGFSVVASPV